MATRKKAGKTSSRAGSAFDDIEVSSAVKKKAKSAVKGAGTKVLLVAFVFLVLGVIVGGGAWWFLCRNDGFSLVGSEEVSLMLGQNYVDEGVEIVAFGQDESASVIVDTNLIQNADGSYTADDVGTYYIAYTSNCFKYGTLFKIQKVRLVTFVEESEGGE